MLTLSQDLDIRFAHHPPRDTTTGDAHAAVRTACRDLAYALARLVPAGREQTVAFQKVEEAMTWANAGIARAAAKADAENVSATPEPTAEPQAGGPV